MLNPERYAPIVTVPNAVGIHFCMMMLIVFVCTIIGLILRKEWKRMKRMMFLTCIFGIGFLFFYFTKFVEEPWNMLNGTMIGVLLLLISSGIHVESEDGKKVE